MPANIFDEIRLASIISNGEPKVMVVKAYILSEIGSGSSKGKNSGLPIVANFIITKSRFAFWAIDYHSRQNTLCCSALRNTACGIENIHSRMLVAANIAKGNT